MSQPADFFEPATDSPGKVPGQPACSANIGAAAKESTAMDAAVLPDSQAFHAYSPPPAWQSAYYPSQFPFPVSPPREKVYAVPKRFGLAALLALMTALAFLFGGLRLLGTPPVIYLFLGMQVMSICVAQMFYNAEPRRASMIAGAIWTPIFSAGSGFFLQGEGRDFAIFWVMPGILFGAFAGYLVGACVAGIFLLMDKVEPFLPGGKKVGA